MKTIKHPIYQDYPEHPYINPNRDLALWEQYPEKFPYKKVELKQMIRVEEGLLPGDLVLLWRISLDTFNNESVYPDYFEYRYGINPEASLEFLFNEGYAEVCSATESLTMLNMIAIKRIMKTFDIDSKGKKDQVLERLLNTLGEPELSKQFTLRKYKTTPLGETVLAAHYDVIQKHGPKM